MLVHFVIYGHSWCFEAFQIALAYGSCNFENFQNITRAHKSRNTLAFMRFPIITITMVIVIVIINGGHGKERHWEWECLPQCSLLHRPPHLSSFLRMHQRFIISIYNLGFRCSFEYALDHSSTLRNKEKGYFICNPLNSNISQIQAPQTPSI